LSSYTGKIKDPKIREHLIKVDNQLQLIKSSLRKMEINWMFLEKTCGVRSPVIDKALRTIAQELDQIPARERSRVLNNLTQ
jgi:predicted metal-dependent hydrolase